MLPFLIPKAQNILWQSPMGDLNIETLTQDMFWLLQHW